jgi:hypothetical protein
MGPTLEFANPAANTVFTLDKSVDFTELPLKNAGTGHITITSVTHTGAADAVSMDWSTTAFPNSHSATGVLTVARNTMVSGEIELLGKLVVERSDRPVRSGCFAGDTLVLMADGTARAIASVTAGDRIATIAELDHLRARPERSMADVEEVHRHDGELMLLEVGGIGVTADHRWAVHDGIEPGFAATERLNASQRLLAITGLVEMRDQLPRAPAQTVWNLTTSARTYCVAMSQAGPFFVVHNTKKRTGPTHEPGGNKGSAGSV